MKKMSKEILKIVLVLIIGVSMFSMLHAVKATDAEEVAFMEEMIGKNLKYNSTKYIKWKIHEKEAPESTTIGYVSDGDIINVISAKNDSEWLQIKLGELTGFLKFTEIAAEKFSVCEEDDDAVAEDEEEAAEEVTETENEVKTDEEETVVEVIDEEEEEIVVNKTEEVAKTETTAVTEKEEENTSSGSSLLSALTGSTETTGTSGTLLNKAINFMQSDTMQAILSKVIEIVKSLITSFVPAISSLLGS